MAAEGLFRGEALECVYANEELIEHSGDVVGKPAAAVWDDRRLAFILHLSRQVLRTGQPATLTLSHGTLEVQPVTLPSGEAGIATRFAFARVAAGDPAPSPVEEELPARVA